MFDEGNLILLELTKLLSEGEYYMIFKIFFVLEKKKIIIESMI